MTWPYVLAAAVIVFGAVVSIGVAFLASGWGAKLLILAFAAACIYYLLFQAFRLAYNRRRRS